MFVFVLWTSVLPAIIHHKVKYNIFYPLYNFYDTSVFPK